MKNKSQTLRAVTEPISHKFFQKSIKIQGILHIDANNQINKKTTIIDVKPNGKVLFHCYKRYKTFSYSFDHVYEQVQGEQFYGGSFGKQNAVDSVNLGVNYMMFCTGGTVKSSNTQLPYIGNMFYHQLAAVYERMIQDESYSWTIHALAITDDTIYDISTDRKTVQLRQIISNKNPSLSQICLMECYTYQPETSYQIFELIKQGMLKKNKLYPKSYFGLYCEVVSNKKENKSRLFFIDATKDMGGYDKNWDNASCLVLNKCILGLQNKMDNCKETYAPFRDCRLTRLMKPFLCADAKVDAIGFVDATDEEWPLTTLNLIKNLARLKVPILKNLQNQSIMIQNPESMPQKKQTYQLRNHAQQSRVIEQVYSPYHHRKISNPRTEKSEEDKSDFLYEQIRKNAKQQHEEQKKLNKIRVQIKMLKKKKEINLSRVLLQNKSKAIEDQLEEEQYQFAKKKELEILNKVEETNKNMLETIEKSISKVQKLKLLRQYYTTAMLNQKEQAAQYDKSQQLLSKFYEERLHLIDKNLKKSPKQLLEYQDQHLIDKNSSNRRYESIDPTEKTSLPRITSKQKKRIMYIKQKVKKGRVEYQEFLSKNVSQYKSYLSSEHSG